MATQPAPPTERGHSLQELGLPDRVHEECQKALLVLKYAHQTASSLLEAYEDIRKARKAKAGTSTDKEQDLFRAMLVMAAAGLDGVAKQLIRDAVPQLVAKNDGARRGLETFIVRQIRTESDLLNTADGAKFIARLLAAPSHQKQAIEEYIRKLTGGSLQSADELVRVASALGLQASDIQLEKDEKAHIQAIFAIRNTIIHELDMDLAGKQRKRNSRGVEDMKGYTDKLLAIGACLVKGTDRLLGPKHQGS